MNFKFRIFQHTDKNHFLSLASNDRERGFIKNTIKLLDKNDAVAYVLLDDGKRVGFIALSASRVDAIPSVLIDYIFVSNAYRNQIFTDLSDSKVSEFLLSFALRKAKDIQKEIGIRWLSLLPDNEKLEHYYKDKFGFFPYKDKTKQTYLFYKI